MKKCSVCKIEKTENNFNKCQTRPDGLQTACKECSGKMNKLWYLNNKKKHQLLVKEWRSKNRITCLKNSKNNVLKFPLGLKGYRNEDYCELLKFEHNLNNLKIEEIGYLAGLFDGEGCISKVLNKKSKHGYVIRAIIYNTNKDVMEWLSHILEVDYYKPTKRQGCKEIYVWRVVGYKCQLFLARVLPYLKIKHNMALEMINKFSEDNDIDFKETVNA